MISAVMALDGRPRVIAPVRVEAVDPDGIAETAAVTGGMKRSVQALGAVPMRSGSWNRGRGRGSSSWELQEPDSNGNWESLAQPRGTCFGTARSAINRHYLKGTRDLNCLRNWGDGGQDRESSLKEEQGLLG